ncbi:hypothetical protein GFGA_1c0975 [Gluconobacter frateurii NBRC 103465]|nr:hypothetical protein GFGA_1c0975 [Gluconobacter frateurii NBRC 103465]
MRPASALYCQSFFEPWVLIQLARQRMNGNAAQPADARFLLQPDYTPQLIGASEKPLRYPVVHPTLPLGPLLAPHPDRPLQPPALRARKTLSPSFPHNLRSATGVHGPKVPQALQKPHDSGDIRDASQYPSTIRLYRHQPDLNWLAHMKGLPLING